MNGFLRDLNKITKLKEELLVNVRATRSIALLMWKHGSRKEATQFFLILILWIF